MWTHFSCNFLLHEISLVADRVFESRLMQLHSAPFPSYVRNGLISWRIGSLRPGHALSIYFVIIVGLWYSRWELDLFVTLSAEASDLVPRCRSECSRCQSQSEWWRKESWLLINLYCLLDCRSLSLNSTNTLLQVGCCCFNIYWWCFFPKIAQIYKHTCTRVIPLTQDINCIVVIDSYVLWVNWLPIIDIFYQYVVARLVIVVLMVNDNVFSPNISNWLTYKTFQLHKH